MNPVSPHRFARFFLLGVIATGLLPPAARASIFGANVLEVNFTREAEARAKERWSDGLAPGPGGLGHRGEPAESLDGWIHTEPFAVGLWWRPAYWVSLRVELSPAPSPITLNDGHAYTPYAGSVYARYSADRAHWSGWQAVPLKQPQPDNTPTGEVLAFLKIATPPLAPKSTVFEGALAVPHREREAYEKHMETFMKLDVPWTSDEEALAGWIVAREPDFFARSIPFVGYIEILFENSFHGGQPVAKLEARATYGMSGMASVPRDPGVGRMNDRSPWRFGAPKMSEHSPDASPPAATR